MIQKFIFLKKFFLLKIIFHFLSDQMLPNCLCSWGLKAGKRQQSERGAAGWCDREQLQKALNSKLIRVQRKWTICPLALP